MMEALKSIFTSEDPALKRKEFFGLTQELEDAVDSGNICIGEGCRCDTVIDTARQLRNLLSSNENMQLQRSDKVRLLKVISKAKVRAILAGTNDGRKTFDHLDLISGDVVQLL
ncbi:MAG: hypothetical protein Q7S22_06500 [Candidatus Micrarchaeota archaeon]|nr:hypothetical protein [Candidatus Micrarchaeota archaeon]